MENVCKFMPTTTAASDIVTVNFVHETHWAETSSLISAVWKVGLISGGEGRLTTVHGTFPLKAGDLFFLFQTQKYSLENLSDLKFYYISFVGARARPLLERLRVTMDHPVFGGFDFLLNRWETALIRTDLLTGDLIAEGLLYDTLSYLPAHDEKETPDDKADDSLVRVKLYVDAHFMDPGLCLASLAADFGYNANYLSVRFRHMIGCPFNRYLTNLRMDHAQKLIREGCDHVTSLAFACGYQDPFYFSKQFKKSCGISPKEAIAKQKEPTD